MHSAKRELTRTSVHLANQALGRTGELRQLHEKLHSTRLPLVITGIGGLGKPPWPSCTGSGTARSTIMPPG